MEISFIRKITIRAHILSFDMLKSSFSRVHSGKRQEPDLVDDCFCTTSPGREVNLGGSVLECKVGGVDIE